MSVTNLVDLSSPKLQASTLLLTLQSSLNQLYQTSTKYHFHDSYDVLSSITVQSCHILIQSHLSQSMDNTFFFFKSTIYYMAHSGRPWYVKIIDGGLHFLFSLFTLFYFYFYFSCLFYFQNNLGQGLSVTLSHLSQVDGVVTRLIMGLEGIEQKVLE